MRNQYFFQKLLEPVSSMYAKRLKTYGCTPKGVFWLNEEWQIKRFQILLRAINTEDYNSGLNIADFGCGYGRLWNFLAKAPTINCSSYVGYDICPDMINTCKATIIDPRAKFIQSLEVTEKTDYIVASGTYNLKGNTNSADWWLYVTYSIQQLWSKTQKALSFNMLGLKQDRLFDGLYYINPEKVYDFCVNRLTKNIEISNDYPLPDTTFTIRR